MTPPTKRFFYTDPLAAAWMSRQFSMKLKYRSLSGIYHDLPVDELLQLVRHSLSRNIYINPDSHDLLNPEIGDCCEWVGTPEERHYAAFDKEDTEYN
jgi:hypothetical protein